MRCNLLEATKPMVEKIANKMNPQFPGRVIGPVGVVVVVVFDGGVGATVAVSDADIVPHTVDSA